MGATGVDMDEYGVGRKRIKIGVCVMEKKVFSAPMGQILDRLQAFGEFEIKLFGDKVILEDPIESWPVCDCLIAFYSSGYPLETAEAYAALRKQDRESDSKAEVEHAEKLRQVKAVLEEGGHFSGIYRKVQLKPLKWVKVAKSNGEGEDGQLKL